MEVNVNQAITVLRDPTNKLPALQDFIVNSLDSTPQPTAVSLLTIVHQGLVALRRSHVLLVTIVHLRRPFRCHVLTGHIILRSNRMRLVIVCHVRLDTTVMKLELVLQVESVHHVSFVSFSSPPIQKWSYCVYFGW